MGELKKLIDFIQDKYLEFNNNWENSEYFAKVNLKKMLVKELSINKNMLDTVFNYREFINTNNVQLIIAFQQFNTKDSKITVRVKAKNSIEYKIENYTKNHESGEVSVNKCLNDLFGIRIICNKELEYRKIKDFIENNYKNLKCIDSSKDDYKATHIYFKKDNFHFQWELQIWNKKDEERNIISHEIYKQDYAKWEKENEGGNK